MAKRGLSLIFAAALLAGAAGASFAAAPSGGAGIHIDGFATAHVVELETEDA